MHEIGIIPDDDPYISNDETRETTGNSLFCRYFHTKRHHPYDETGTRIRTRSSLTFRQQ